MGSISSNKLTSPLYTVIPSYDTGWVACSDWTNQHLGTAVGGNVVHSLGYNLREMLVRVFISTDGTDNNSFEVCDADTDVGSSSYYGLSFFQINTNSILVQTGAGGIRYVRDSDGNTELLTTQSYYYRVSVTKFQSVASVRNVSEDYSASETDTGKRWIDGKTIYRKGFTGTSGTGAWQTVATISGYETVIMLHMRVLGTDSVQYSPSDNYFAATTIGQVVTSGGNVQIYTNSGTLNARTVKGFVEYTKT
jgi:hypothetical protein